MYYGLLIRIKHNNKIRKFGVLNQYGELLQVTYSELIKYVRKGEVVNVAPNGDYITGKNCSITQIPLFDDQMNQVGGVPYEEYRNWVVNEIQRSIQIDNEKELAKQQKEEYAQQKEEIKQEETFRNTINAQQDNEEDLILKYVGTVENAVDTAKREAKKRLNREQYLKYLTNIENYLDKAEYIGTECIRVKNLTNHELRESGATEYRRTMDARTADTNINNYILGYGVIELRNKIGSLYNQAKNIINGELTPRDKEFYIQRLETIKGYIVQIQNLHRETSNILKSNEQTKIEIEQAEKEIKQHEEQVRKDTHNAKVKIQQLNSKLANIRFEYNKLNNLMKSFDDIDDEATNLYEQAIDEVKEAISSDIGIIIQNIEEKREIFEEKQCEYDREQKEKERLAFEAQQEKERLALEEQEKLERERIAKEQAQKLKDEQESSLITAISELNTQIGILAQDKNNIARVDLLNIEDEYTKIKLESDNIEDVSSHILDSLRQLNKKLKSLSNFLEDKADADITKCKNTISKYKTEVNSISKLEDINRSFYEHELNQLLSEIDKAIDLGYITLENYIKKHPSGVQIYTKEVASILDNLDTKYNKLQEEEMNRQKKEQEKAERIERELQAIDKALDIINNEVIVDTVQERDSKERIIRSTITNIEVQTGIKVISNEKVKNTLNNYINDCNKAIEDRKELEKKQKEETERIEFERKQAEKAEQERLELERKQAEEAEKERQRQLEIELKQAEEKEVTKLIAEIQSLEVVDTTDKLRYAIQELRAKNNKDERVQQAISEYKDKCQKAIDKFKQQDILHETAITNNLSTLVYESKIRQAQSSEDIEKIRREIQSLIDRKCKAYESYSFHDSQYDKKAVRAICNFVSKIEKILNDRNYTILVKKLKLKIEPGNLDSALEVYSDNLYNSDNDINEIGHNILREFYSQLKKYS